MQTSSVDSSYLGSTTYDPSNTGDIRTNVISSTQIAPSRGFNMTQCTEFAQRPRTTVSRSASFNAGITPNYLFSDALGAFWQAASIRFAREARGMAHIVFEVADEGPAFCPSDFFGSIELPSMNVNQVTGLDVMVSTNANNPGEICESGSFAVLRSLVEARFSAVPNFVFQCRNDPYELLLVRCASKPESNEACKALLREHFSTKEPSTPPSPASHHACSESCISKKTSTFLMIGIGIGTFVLGFLLSAMVPVIQSHLRCCESSPSTSPSSYLPQMGHGQGNMSLDQETSLLDPDEP